MAYQVKRDAQGNIIDVSLNNPAIGGVSAMSGGVPLPGQNEAFLFGGSNDPNPEIGYRVGNQIYQTSYKNLGKTGLDPSKLSRYSTDFLHQDIGFQIADPGDFSIYKQGQGAGGGLQAPNFQGGVLAPGATAPFAGGNPYVDTSMKTAAQKWVDPATGQQTPAGVGVPQSTQPMGVQISNEADLQAKRQELAKAGVPQTEWNKYISSPDAQGRLFYTQPATLVSPTGQKKVVATGSPEASQLMSAGWSLGGGIDPNGPITKEILPVISEIDIGKSTSSGTYGADTLTAGAAATAKSADEKIKEYYDLQTREKTEDELKLDELYKLIGEGVTGQGAMQMSEEQKRGIEQKNQVIASKNTLLKTKLAEIDALTKSYELANQTEEGRPQTLSRLRGAQGQNYKMYLAQKNALASEAGIMQAEILGLQGELEAAQNAANRAVDLAYADRESKYNALIAQANILSKQVEGDDQKYANAVSQYLQDRANADAEAKQNTKNIQAVKLEAISKGITDAGVLSRIGNAKSYDEALQILGTNMPKETTKPIWGVIGQDEFGNSQYGWINSGTQTVTPYGGGSGIPGGATSQIVTDASGSSYDIGTYATDPNHEANVQSILERIGKMTSVDQMNNYIQSVAKGSPVTGQMIANASQKYGVSWETMMAIMQQDSSFGTAGAGARSFNPGNVGNTETATSTGNLVNFGNWQSGVDAVAQNLAKRKTTTPDQSTEATNRQSILDILGNKRVKIGEAAKTNVSNALNVITAVEDLAKDNQTTGFQGVNPTNTFLDAKIPFTGIGIVPFREAFRSSAGRTNTGAIEAINLKVQQWASGAALTKEQTAQVNRFTPTTSHTDQAVRDKLNNLYNFMLTQVEGTLLSQGINFKPQQADLFETYELIKKASSEQLAELKAAGLIK